MYEETLQFYYMWRLAVQERDEAREHLIHSLAELSQLRELFKTILLSEEQKNALYHPEITEETTVHQNWNYDHFSVESPSPFSSVSPLDLFSNIAVNPSPEMCDADCYSFRSNQSGFAVENRRDFEDYVLEIIGGVLPENGKFLQAVSEAGPLVELLFTTGLVPRWSNPPVRLLSQRPVLSSE